MFDLKVVKNNMYDDIKKANSKQLRDIHSLLVELLRKYDDDGKWKDFKDFVGLALTPALRNRCKKKFNDLIEEWNELIESRRKEFESDIISLINKRQSLLELFGNLFRGL